MSCLTRKCSQFAKTYSAFRSASPRRSSCRLLMATLILPTLMFAGCMTHPGDRYIVHKTDWKLNWQFDPELRRHIMTGELPLEFVGHTRNPSELITLQAWIPNENVLEQTELYRDPLVPNRGEIARYFDRQFRSGYYFAPDDEVNDAINNRVGTHIPGHWATIGTATTTCHETMPGWYTWSKQVQFSPEGDDWKVTFGQDRDNDSLFRFDFRALGNDGRPLGCWKQGFSQYFDFGADPIEQYPAHRADIPERMSVYYYSHMQG